MAAWPTTSSQHFGRCFVNRFIAFLSVGVAALDCFAAAVFALLRVFVVDVDPFTDAADKDVLD